LSTAVSWWSYRVQKKHSSAVLIPYIGPVCLTVWIVQTNKSYWFIPAAWVCDLGTIAFTSVLPRLIKDAWHVSTITKAMTLVGRSGNAEAELTLHKGGHYLLRKRWNRRHGDFGPLSRGEPGRYIEVHGNFHLTACDGASWTLQRMER